MRLLLFAFFMFLSKASRAQVLFEGNHLIEAYLGMPNMARFTSGFNFDSDNGSQKVTKFGGLAPSGFRYTYVVYEDITIGFDLIYNRSNVTSVKTSTFYDGVSGQWINSDTIFQDVSNRLRFHARVNFHFSTLDPEADSYFGIGLGTNNRWIKSYRDGVLEEVIKGSEASLLPFSMRICYGYRYFFGYNWGISGEVGLGGPLISLGVSYKL